MEDGCPSDDDPEPDDRGLLSISRAESEGSNRSKGLGKIPELPSVEVGSEIS